MRKFAATCMASPALKTVSVFAATEAGESCVLAYREEGDFTVFIPRRLANGALSLEREQRGDPVIKRLALSVRARMPLLSEDRDLYHFNLSDWLLRRLHTQRRRH